MSRPQVKRGTENRLRRGVLRLLTVCLSILLGACGAGSSDALPEELLGRWNFLGSSGGIDGGRGKDEATGFIVLHPGRMDVYDGRGVLVSQEGFSSSRGRTIYAGDDRWILGFEGGDAYVVLVSPDGRSMSLTPNAYDAIGRDYARTR